MMVSLFKLPSKDVEVGTIFTITALPSSRIYIVQEVVGAWTYEDLSVSNSSWTKENCTDDPFEVKRPAAVGPGVFPKQFEIFHLDTGSISSTTVLPAVTKAHRHVAMFLKESKV